MHCVHIPFISIVNGLSLTNIGFITRCCRFPYPWLWSLWSSFSQRPLLSRGKPSHWQIEREIPGLIFINDPRYSCSPWLIINKLVESNSWTSDSNPYFPVPPCNGRATPYDWKNIFIMSLSRRWVRWAESGATSWGSQSRIRARGTIEDSQAQYLRIRMVP